MRIELGPHPLEVSPARVAAGERLSFERVHLAPVGATLVTLVNLLNIMEVLFVSHALIHVRREVR